MYIRYEDYVNLYDPIDDRVFNRLAYDACRHIDKLTTGIDGVKKLKVAFPVDEDSASAVRHCAAQVINILLQVQEAEKSASLSRGYDVTENGLKGKVVSSVSAGNESVSYSAGISNTVVDAAAFNPAARDSLISQTIRQCLSGVQDANGVNLLYMGVYPRV